MTEMKAVAMKGFDYYVKFPKQKKAFSFFLEDKKNKGTGFKYGWDEEKQSFYKQYCEEDFYFKREYIAEEEFDKASKKVTIWTAR